MSSKEKNNGRPHHPDRSWNTGHSSYTGRNVRDDEYDNRYDYITPGFGNRGHLSENGYSFYYGPSDHSGHDDNSEERQVRDRRKTDNQVNADSNSVTSFDSAGKRKSFRRLITRFAEKTSMQGVPYINNARFWWAKLLWSILLIAAISAMLLHLWYLFSQYYSRPLQTKIGLGFANLRFPQVTICNTNIIHKGRFNTYGRADALKSLVDALQPENLVPDQFDDNYDPYNPNPSTDQQTATPSGNPLPSIRRKRFVDNYEKLDPKKYQSDFKDYAEDRELNEDEYDEPIDSTTTLAELFNELYMDINKFDRGQLGHNITDMLLSCTFNGRKCSEKQFKLYQTSDFGNCWTLESTKFNVQSSGPKGGLSLVFYLESTEYLTGLASGYGARLQIQEPQTFPYPADEGLFIPASMETSIGLKMLNIQRKGQPYAYCDEGIEFRRKYKLKYTRRACQSMCKLTKIIDSCECFDDTTEEEAITVDKSLKPCRSDVELTCLERILIQFDRKEINCTCHNPCSEVDYVVSASNRQWPNDDYAMILLQSVCDRDPAVCKTLRGNLNDNRALREGRRALNNNFLKLNIFYEDLNFENITEVPEIEEAQFISDVGGAVGLWIGLSVLSMCELLQLLLELCDLGVHKTIKERRREKKRRRRQANKANRDKANSSGVSEDKTRSQNNNRYIERQWPNTQFGFNDKYPRNMYNSYPSGDQNYADRRADIGNY